MFQIIIFILFELLHLPFVLLKAFWQWYDWVKLMLHMFFILICWGFTRSNEIYVRNFTKIICIESYLKFNFKYILWYKHVVNLWEAHNLLDFILKQPLKKRQRHGKRIWKFWSDHVCWVNAIIHEQITIHTFLLFTQCNSCKHWADQQTSSSSWFIRFY